jgi:tetratricopeptide (TPR) repeat protein
MAKAGVQGAKILEADPENTMGLYLKAEGLLRAGKTAEARALFQQATEDKDPLFFDGLGRAAEKFAEESGDSKYQDTALRAYKEATDLDPTMLTSLVGQGRLYVLRGQDKDAVAPLTAASKIKMTAEIARLLGLAAEAMQQGKAAAAWLELSDKMEPNALTSWRLAELYTSAALNQPRKAVSALGRATHLAERQEKDTGVEVAWLTEALYKQGDTNKTLGNDAAARTAWEKYLARNPKGPAARIAEVKHFLATSLKRP